MRYRTQLPNDQKYVILVIRNILDNQISGSIYHALQGELINFHGFMELAEEMENLSNDLTYPSICMERRSLLNDLESTSLEERVDQIEHCMRSRMPLHTYRLQIHHRLSGTWQGTLQDRESGNLWQFESFMELIGIIEDESGISKKDSYVPLLPLGTYVYKKDRQEFIIRILFKKNKSWQGSVHWVNGKKTVNFRSYLELILILREVLEDTGKKASIIDLNDYGQMVRSS